ncbi:Transposon TX1 uncharacterized 149 kDa protein [Vitis vinifera]|uniref:Transposon TX1 uncharacterized 149 kDa protein n=1 Tax=Vitis vinifera TaxID=29760 RepID=A0A438JKD0_VITVI|nr:Transposon TX1 uncharacterized 149 kDa protein [Vitis vinifera]
MERGFRASPLFHCQSTRNRKRCSGEGASSSRGEAVLRNPHFEKDKEGLLSRVGLYLYGSLVTDLPYNLEIRGKGLNFKGNCEMLVVENWSPFGPDLPSSVSHSQSPMENRVEAQFAYSNQMSESVNPSKSKPVLPKEFPTWFILGGRVDAPQVYETCWNWFGGLGSMRFLHENNQLEYQGRFVGSVWTFKNKDWAALPACGALGGILIIGTLKNCVVRRCLQEALPRRTSDHWPIVLDTNLFKWGPTPFRFENMWLQHPSFKESFRSWWRGFQGNGWEGHKFMRRLQFVKASRGLTSELLLQRALRKGEVEELILREEIHWRQKARVKWVKKGDCNSKFFHKVANGRRNRKFNKVLENESGLVLNNSESITEKILLYFEKLYASLIGESWSAEGLDWSPMSEESASRLDSPFTEDEISKAIFQLDRDKAPRLDDFTIVVFQDCWDMIRRIYLTKKISDFRPISLINSLYKIIVKVLSGRLRGVLHETIYSTQGAFVQGRQILDAVLIANEIVSEKRRSGEEGVVFKIDFEKAYDHVSWDILDHVLEKKGFSPRWRKWMSGCLSTVSYAVLVNGNAKGVGRNRTRVSHLQFANDTIFFSNTREEELQTLKSLLLAELLECKASGWPILYLGLLWEESQGLWLLGSSD